MRNVNWFDLVEGLLWMNIAVLIKIPVVVVIEGQCSTTVELALIFALASLNVSQELNVVHK